VYGNPEDLPLIARTCYEGGLPAVLSSVHQLTSSSLAGSQATAQQEAGTSRAKGSSCTAKSNGDTEKALKLCLVYACTCYFKMLVPLAIW
jgi:hypothetical protein